MIVTGDKDFIPALQKTRQKGMHIIYSDSTYGVYTILHHTHMNIPHNSDLPYLGKRVAICSMRNSCNRDLVRPDNNIKDFDMIWMDDYIDLLLGRSRISALISPYFRLIFLCYYFLTYFQCPDRSQ